MKKLLGIAVFATSSLVLASCGNDNNESGRVEVNKTKLIDYYSEIKESLNVESSTLSIKTNSVMNLPTDEENKSRVLASSGSELISEFDLLFEGAEFFLNECNTFVTDEDANEQMLSDFNDSKIKTTETLNADSFKNFCHGQTGSYLYVDVDHFKSFDSIIFEMEEMEVIDLLVKYTDNGFDLSFVFGAGTEFSYFHYEYNSETKTFESFNGSPTEGFEYSIAVDGDRFSTVRAMSHNHYTLDKSFTDKYLERREIDPSDNSLVEHVYFSTIGTTMYNYHNDGYSEYKYSATTNSDYFNKDSYSYTLSNGNMELTTSTWIENYDAATFTTESNLSINLAATNLLGSDVFTDSVTPQQFATINDNISAKLTTIYKY